MLLLFACAQAQDEVRRQLAALEQEKKLMQTLDVADNDIVDLNVGGTLFSTKRSTLMQVIS